MRRGKTSNVTDLLRSHHLPDPGWSKYWERIYLDTGVKERLVRHGLLQFSGDFPGLDGFATSRHGVVVLTGPPGTGKTMLSRGVANEMARRSRSEVVFRHVRIDQLASSRLGETQEAIGGLFGEVRESAERGVRQVLLLDEVESLFVSREEVSGGTDPADVRTGVNVALQELDDLAGKGVFVVATSNLEESVDEAFQSRADAVFHVGLPGPKHRSDILIDVFSVLNSRLGASLPTKPEELGELVALTEGLSGRDLRKSVQNVLVADEVFEDPSRLELSHVLDEFRDEDEGLVDRAYSFESIYRADCVRSLIPDEYLSEEDDGRCRTVRLADDAPGGWVEFVAGIPSQDFQAGSAALPSFRLLDGTGGNRFRVDELNPRFAVYDPAGSDPDSVMSDIKGFILATLTNGGYSIHGPVEALLASDRVAEAFREAIRLEALEGVRVSGGGLTFEVVVEFEDGEQFLEPPGEHLVPELGSAEIELVLDGGGGDLVDRFSPLEADSVRVVATEAGGGRL